MGKTERNSYSHACLATNIIAMVVDLCERVHVLFHLLIRILAYLLRFQSTVSVENCLYIEQVGSRLCLALCQPKAVILTQLKRVIVKRGKKLLYFIDLKQVCAHFEKSFSHFSRINC